MMPCESSEQDHTLIEIDAQMTSIRQRILLEKDLVLVFQLLPDL